jgi:hypothetical protein
VGERRRARQAEAELIQQSVEARAAFGPAVHGHSGRLVQDQHQAVAVEEPRQQVQGLDHRGFLPLDSGRAGRH